MSDEVLITRKGPLTRLGLNRPERLNAFNGALRTALHDALTSAASDTGCRALLLCGEGRGFSAGQDLADVQDGADLGQLLDTGYAPIVRLIRTMPKPVICAVQGVAAGAGANLALNCDFVLAGHSARFIQAFVRIGLLPDVGGTWVLPKLIGMARTRAAAMLGDPIDAARAEAWGMIFRAVPDDTLLDEAERLAARLAELPAQALAAMKRAFDAAENNSFDQQLALENSLQTALGQSSDFQEGKRAFLEKRSPRFAGAPG